MSSTKIVVVLEHFLITADILSNSFSDYFGSTIISRLGVYVIQDLCLILSLIILLLLFFRNKILRNGLLTPLLRVHWLPFLVTIVYTTLTLTLQILTIDRMDVLSQGKEDADIDPRHILKIPHILCLFFIQRVTSALHYFSTKSAVMKLLDPGMIESFNQQHNHHSSRRTSTCIS